MLQLQLKDSTIFKIGREDHGFNVFSKEILYGYLLCIPFIRYVVICFGYCKITALSCNLTFRCIKRRFVFNWFGMDCYWFITLQTGKIFLVKYEYWLHSCSDLSCRELSITITFSVRNKYWKLSLTFNNLAARNKYW